MIHPIECEDEYSVEGIENAADLARWLNSWLADDDVETAVIRKVATVDSTTYTLAPAVAGDNK